MLAVELSHLADMMDDSRIFKNISTLAKGLSKRITDAIWKTTVCGKLNLSGVFNNLSRS